jgi:hypothetical protein
MKKPFNRNQIWYNGCVNSGKESIKTFVKQTLGCACPEEVFTYIDCQSNIKMNDIVLNSKINIGNKLLIYVVEINNRDSIKKLLPFLVSTGKKERDNLGFNRFRLVLVTEKLNEIKETAERAFKTIPKDEKIHLHVVLKNKVPIFLKTKQ